MKIQSIINVPNGVPPKDRQKAYPDGIIWNKKTIDTFERKKPAFSGIKVNAKEKRYIKTEITKIRNGYKKGHFSHDAFLEILKAFKVKIKLFMGVKSWNITK